MPRKILLVLIISLLPFAVHAGQETVPCAVAGKLLWSYFVHSNGQPEGAEMESLTIDTDQLVRTSPDCVIALYRDQNTQSEVKAYLRHHAEEMAHCQAGERFNWCGIGEDENCGTDHEPDYCQIYPDFYKRLAALDKHAQTH